jgi:hypothetical protein
MNVNEHPTRLRPLHKLGLAAIATTVLSLGAVGISYAAGDSTTPPAPKAPTSVTTEAPGTEIADANEAPEAPGTEQADDGDEAPGTEEADDANEAPGTEEADDANEVDGVDCEDGIDAATGASCDGGPEANHTDPGDAPETTATAGK